LVRLGPVWKRSDWPHSDEEPFEDWCKGFKFPVSAYNNMFTDVRHEKNQTTFKFHLQWKN
jgi:hypothetical protein